jgi:hypothetical protein
MSPNAQRIAIAVACGWTYPRIVNEDPMGRPPETTDRFEVVPDYLNDLNAMHEAEKVLTPTQREAFAWHLCWGKYDWYKSPELPGNREPNGSWLEESQADAFKTYHSTAAQRAEAFLRTIGKWEAKP